MWALPVALSSSLLVTAIVLWFQRRVFPNTRMSIALAAGTAGGHIGWAAANEFSAASSESSMGETLRAILRTFTSPSEAVHWVVPILLLSSVAVLVWGLWQRRPLNSAEQKSLRRNWLGVVFWMCVYAGTLVRLLWGSVYMTRRWSMTETVVTIAVHVAILTFILLASRQPANNRFLAGRFILATITGSAACAVIGMSGSAVYAQLLATAVASLVLITGLVWWQRNSDQPLGWPVGMVLLVVVSHLWLGHYFAELTLLDGALLLGSLGAGAVLGWGGESRSAWFNKALPVFVSLALSLAAVADAGIRLSRTLSNPSW